MSLANIKGRLLSLLAKALAGPVGTYHSLKLRHKRWRLAKLGLYLDREYELHIEHSRMLRAEIEQCYRERHQASRAADAFWRWYDQVGGSR